MHVIQLLGITIHNTQYTLPHFSESLCVCVVHMCTYSVLIWECG